MNTAILVCVLRLYEPTLHTAVKTNHFRNQSAQLHKHNGLTGRFLGVAATVYRKMMTIIEIHPPSITTIFGMQV